MDEEFNENLAKIRGWVRDTKRQIAEVQAKVEEQDKVLHSIKSRQSADERQTSFDPKCRDCTISLLAILVSSLGVKIIQERCKKHHETYKMEVVRE